jgi:hypothetical protein
MLNRLGFIDPLSSACILASVLAVGLIPGCTQPDPNTVAGRSDIAGQQCAVCMATNPGDYWACHAICVQRIEDEGAYLKAVGH